MNIQELNLQLVSPRAKRIATLKAAQAARVAGCRRAAAARRGVKVSTRRHSKGGLYLEVNVASATAKAWGLHAGDHVDVVSGTRLDGRPVLGIRPNEEGGYKLRRPNGCSVGRCFFTIAISSLGEQWSTVTTLTECNYAPVGGYGLVWPRNAVGIIEEGKA